jgi:hypothetical protein
MGDPEADSDDRRQRVETCDSGGGRRPQSTYGVTVVFAKD